MAESILKVDDILLEKDTSKLDDESNTKRSRDDLSENETDERCSKKPRQEINTDIIVQSDVENTDSIMKTNGITKVDDNANQDLEEKKISEMADVTKHDEISSVKSENIKMDEDEEPIEDKDTISDDTIEEEKSKRRNGNSNKTEVIEGLELSVECASEIDSSEGEQNKNNEEEEEDSELLPITTNEKVKPNDGELEKIEKDKKHKTGKIKNVRMRKASLSKSGKNLKNNDNDSNDDDDDDDNDNENDDDDTKPGNEKSKKSTKKQVAVKKSKRNVKKGVAKKKEKSSEDEEDTDGEIDSNDDESKVTKPLQHADDQDDVESEDDDNHQKKKRGNKSKLTKKRGGNSVEEKKLHSHKLKEKAKLSKDNDDTNDDNIEDEDTNSTNKSDKMNVEHENKSAKENSGSDESDSNDSEEISKKGEKKKSNSKFEDQVANMKKFIKAAGIRVKKYDDLWLNCKTNSQKIDRLKELLEKNGVSGRPTLEKCRIAKAKREQDREIAELDLKNIISEGRVTRSTKNLSKKNSPAASGSQDSSSRQQEIRKRIRHVVDSDSE